MLQRALGERVVLGWRMRRRLVGPGVLPACRGTAQRLRHQILPLPVLNHFVVDVREGIALQIIRLQLGWACLPLVLLVVSIIVFDRPRLVIAIRMM